MILVDSSVWIDFFNGHPSPEAIKLRSIIASGYDIAISGIIAAEVLSGFRDEKTFVEVEETFLNITHIPHDFNSYVEAARMYRKLRSKGITIRSIIDCLIAVAAIQNNMELLCKDKDFRNVQKVFKDLTLKTF